MRNLQGLSMCLEVRRTHCINWADRYVTEVQRVLTLQWGDLTARVCEEIAQLSLRQLALGPPNNVGQCAIQSWVRRHLEPLIEQALEEFRNRIHLDPQWPGVNLGAGIRTEGELSTTDVLSSVAIPSGVAAGVTGVVYGVTTTTTLLVFTTATMNWPVLITGLVGGTMLVSLGFVRLSAIRSRLRQRMAMALEPGLRDALIGEGVTREGVRVPSLLQQLQQQFRDVSADALQRLRAEEHP